MECAKPIFDLFVDRLKDLYKQSVGYYIAFEENVRSLKQEMKILEGKKDDTMRAVNAAEKQGLQKTNQVKIWLEDVQEVEVEASRIDGEFQALFKCCGDYPLNVLSGCQLSRNAEQKLAKVRNLKNSGDFAVIADDLIPVNAREMPCARCVGQDEQLAQLDSFVRGIEVGIVGIFGMGGVGKTTLLNRINNELRRVEHNFDMVMSIEVSETVNVKKIQRMIVSRLGLEWKEEDDVKERAIKILQALSRMKFVIMLDDVWEPLDLSSLGIPVLGSPYDSKIVVASRIEDVCTRMEAQKVIKVDCLGWEEAWSLFLEKAGKELISSQPQIEGYARTMVAKCGGLPVALSTIGRAMAAKRTIPEWRHAVRALSSTPAEIQGMEREVLLRLKRSYDNLTSEKLKLCFLYFILFKEESKMYANDLVSYWIGEAIIDDFDDVCEAYVEGHDIVCRLKTACLLESVEGDQVKMHGMIHSMAKWVASECGKERNKWLVQPGFELREAPELEKWKAAERISLVGNYISSMHPGVPECPHLLSLMLNNNNLLCSLSNQFFESMPSLRVLDLSSTSIEELPPEIDKLVELQFLNLSGTKLVSVPSAVGKLGKLRYLDLSCIPTLKTFPEGVMEGLSAELRVLRMFESYGGWTTGATATGGEGRFEELEGLKQLKMLTITVESAKVLHQLSGSRRLAMPTHTLHLRGLQGTTAVTLPSDLGCNMKKLKQLCINHSNSLEEVVINNDGWCSYLPQLDFLRFESLDNAKIIFKVMPSGSMHNLATLEIRGCPKVEQLISMVVETGAQDGVGERTAFSGLQFLYLINLPELKSICGSMLVLPSLRTLKVEGCPKLKRLPFGSQSCSKLEEIQGHQEWWDGLEWDDAATRDSFLPLFCGPFCRRCHCIHG
uniref:Putative disease resistance protein At5g63020 n=1 Tax=Anthurium amnicola TaxID=1678845 RepID=A0A1D1YNM0_9ARAE